MSEPQVITTLTTKAEMLASLIGKLEVDLEQARADLAHVVATVRLFEAPQDGEAFPSHMNLDRLFRRQEIGKLCHQALADGPKDTRELALYIIRQKGFDERDRHLRTSVALRIVQALRMQEHRGMRIRRAGKRGTAIIWELDGWRA
jgi:hypothetical protein